VTRATIKSAIKQFRKLAREMYGEMTDLIESKWPLHRLKKRPIIFQPSRFPSRLI
jgi:hypothetical protein